MADPIKPPAKKPDETISVLKAFARLLKTHTDAPDDAQEHALGGLTRQKTIDDAVNDAVNGAPKKPEDF